MCNGRARKSCTLLTKYELFELSSHKKIPDDCTNFIVSWKYYTATNIPLILVLFYTIALNICISALSPSHSWLTTILCLRHNDLELTSKLIRVLNSEDIYRAVKYKILWPTSHGTIILFIIYRRQNKLFSFIFYVQTQKGIRNVKWS